MISTDHTTTDRHSLETIEFPKVRSLIAKGAVSALGREAIEQTMPYTDVRDVRHAQTVANEMTQAVRFDDTVPMRGLIDIRQSLETASMPGSRLDAARLLNIAQTADTSRRLRGYFRSREGKYPNLWDIASALEVCGELCDEINRAIDPSGIIKDSASPKLGRIRKELEGSRQSLRSRLDTMLSRLSADVVADRVIAMREGRPVIPVKAGYKQRVAGIVHDQSATGQTVFIEPMEAVEHSNRIRQLELDEEQEIDRILLQLSEIVRENLPRLEVSVEALTELDALYAIGEYADRYECVSPRLTEDGTFELVEMRHPLLEARLRARSEDDEERKGAVPLTCRMEPGARLLAISGPNAGGKTVAIKTMGLALAMTQAGFLIPAAHLTALPVFGQIFAEIGDEQSIDDDLSTFSSRMRDLAHVCTYANARTFVLVDELGSATDPDQGAALARAILSRLNDRGSLAVVTTHLGSIKEYAHEKDWAVNASMEFDTETLRPTFRLIVGIPGSSYAMEISRRVGLDARVITEAERELGEAAVNAERLIADLSSRLEQVHSQQEELAERDRHLTANENDYQSRFEKVNKERERLRRTAQEEAEKIINDARSLVERTVADLRKEQASTESIKAARRNVEEGLQDVRKKMKAGRKHPRKRPTDLEVGNWVRITSLGKTGELVSLTKTRAAVQTDVARLEVPVEQIERLADQAPQKKQTTSVVTSGSKAEDFQSELDVRGMLFEEAWSVVDRCLDDARMLSYPRIRVIHGKGTGALKVKFAQQFDQDPRVAKHEMAEWNQGGAGVTVVEVRP